MEFKDVFISYKAEDFDDANWVKTRLERNGISCWLAPGSIPGGSSYAVEIPRAIRHCKAFVLLLSEKAQRSKWVPRELDQAINANKIVLPFMLEDCALKDDFNFYLTNVQRYAAYESKADAIEKMIREIKAIIRAQEPAPAPAPEPAQEPEPAPAPEPEPTLTATSDPAPTPEPTPPPVSVPVEVPAQPEKTGETPAAVKTLPKTKAAKKQAKPNAGKKKRTFLIAGCSVAAAVVLAVVAAVVFSFCAERASRILIAGKTFHESDSFVSLTDVTLTAADLTSFDRFEKLTNIHLQGCTLPGDVGNLCRPELRSLALVDCGLTDATLQSLDFAKLTALYSLDLSENDLSSPAAFAALADTLEKLNLSGNRISDLSAFSAFGELTELQVSDNGVQTLSPLASCTALTTLAADGNQISDLSPLAACTRLRTLSVNGNRLTSLAGLERCLDLASLEAGSNQLTALSGLENATVLRHVFLNDNKITDLSLLAKSAAKLDTLYCRNNQIQALNFPAGLPALTYLNADGNALTSLAPLENSANLAGVSARGNQITSVKGLENKPQLSYLDLANNKIQLTGDEKLQCSAEMRAVVNLSGNPLGAFRLSASKGFSYLNLHGTGLRDFAALYAATGANLFVDYSDALDLSALKAADYGNYYVFGCPLDKQVAVREALGNYFVKFAEESDCDKIQSPYINANIQGNAAYYK